MNDKRLDPNEIRKFGTTLVIVLWILAGVHWARTGHIRVWMFVIGFGVLVPAIIRPVLLRPVLRVWLRIATGISYVMTHIILVAFYYLVITPTGIVMRAVGHDPMKRRYDAESATYWEDLPDEEVPRERYLKQY